jgi:hypothetical protein
LGYHEILASFSQFLTFSDSLRAANLSVAIPKKLWYCPFCKGGTIPMMKKIQYVPLRKGQMDKYLEMAKRENVYPIIYIGLVKDAARAR